MILFAVFSQGLLLFCEVFLNSLIYLDVCACTVNPQFVF